MSGVRLTKFGNVPWLKSLPSHWGVVSSKRLFHPRKELARPDDEQLSATQAYGVIRQKDFERRVGRKVVKILQHLDKRRHVEKDDFVISMRSFQGGLERAWAPGCIRSSYVVIEPSAHADASYFGHLFKSHDFIQALRATSNFIRDGQDLNLSNFYLVDLPLPPLDEQQSIGKYLNFVDRKITRLIGAKKKLILLLNEQKRVLIHRAVTRGLNPNAKLKPSGIEWLGGIPTHWRMGRIKSELLNLNTKRVPLSAPERGKMTSRKYEYYGASSVIDRVDDYLFDDDLLLIAEDGANLVLRNLPLAIIARGKFWVNNHAHILKPRRGSLEYFAALLESIEYSPWITGAAQPKLTQDRLMAVRIPVPPEEEQGAIVNWIERNTRELQIAIEQAKKETELLREFRTRLVVDVVTGKLDVREAAAKLPDISREALTLDEMEDLSQDESTAEEIEPDAEEEAA